MQLHVVFPFWGEIGEAMVFVCLCVWEGGGLRETLPTSPSPR